jgi:hypothetical protein
MNAERYSSLFLSFNANRVLGFICDDGQREDVVFRATASVTNS